MHLSVVDGALCQTYVIAEYDSTKADGYEVGDQCYHEELVDGVMTNVHKCCILDTPTPAGTYDTDNWEDYE